MRRLASGRDLRPAEMRATAAGIASVATPWIAVQSKPALVRSKINVAQRAVLTQKCRPFSATSGPKSTPGRNRLFHSVSDTPIFGGCVTALKAFGSIKTKRWSTATTNGPLLASDCAWSAAVAGLPTYSKAFSVLVMVDISVGDCLASFSLANTRVFLASCSVSRNCFVPDTTKFRRNFREICLNFALKKRARGQRRSP